MAAGPDIREETDRLVSTALAAAAYAMRGAGRFLGHERISTGTPECCVCPVCRGIAAVRNPSPEFAWKVASGASDVATGIAAVLRAFQPAPPRPRPAPRPRDSGPTWRAATRADEPAPPTPADGGDVWRAATTAPAPSPAQPPAPPEEPAS